MYFNAIKKSELKGPNAPMNTKPNVKWAVKLKRLHKNLAAV